MPLPGLVNTMGGAVLGNSGTMLSAIQALTLTTNLKLCLDAGDSASVASGSQTKWLDVAGSGYDFNRGTTTAVEGSDPTFNGTVGGGSVNEYWAVGGPTQKYFTYDTTNETWMTALHKDSAVFSWAFWSYLAAYGTAGNALAGTAAVAAGTGTGWGLRSLSTGKLTLAVLNAGATVLSQSMVATATAAGWNYFAGSLDETSGALVMQTNSTIETFAGKTYTSPSSGAPTFTMQIASTGNSTSSDKSDRMAAAVMWQGTALSSAQINSIFNATRSRFGV